jgi:hypothetical protein
MLVVARLLQYSSSTVFMLWTDVMPLLTSLQPPKRALPTPSLFFAAQ